MGYRYVSPRTRAQRTLELLNLGCRAAYPWSDSQDADDFTNANEKEECRTNATIEVTEAVREWDYGAYEGKTSPDIRRERKEAGLDEVRRHPMGIRKIEHGLMYANDSTGIYGATAAPPANPLPTSPRASTR